MWLYWLTGRSTAQITVNTVSIYLSIYLSDVSTDVTSLPDFHFPFLHHFKISLYIKPKDID